MPTPYAYLRKQFMPLAEAKIGVMTHAFNYGTGCFEGIRGNWNEGQEKLFIFRLRDHFHRLRNSCRILSIDLPYTEDELCDVAVKLVGMCGYKLLSETAGKTTLMKLIAGLYPPTSGVIEVEGRINFLAGFGIGMLDELSVVENAMLYAAIYGVERKRLEANLDEIVSWAGLEGFQQTLFKHLSAGMKVRLAFSTYRYFDGDIFLMDEALSAGDQDFRKKCHQVLLNQRETNRTMVIASHNTPFIREFCNKTLWIEHGQLKAYGATDDVVQRYRASANPEGKAAGEDQQPTDGY